MGAPLAVSYNSKETLFLQSLPYCWNPEHITLKSVQMLIHNHASMTERRRRRGVREKNKADTHALRAQPA
jgi:hypothetical protein